MSFQATVLHELGDQLGLALEFDAQQRCALLLDQSHLVTLNGDDRGWLLHGLLRENADSDSCDPWQLLDINLDLALEQAGTLAFDNHNRTLAYLEWLPLDRLTADNAYRLLEQFTDRLEHLKSGLA